MYKSLLRVLTELSLCVVVIAGCAPMIGEDVPQVKNQPWKGGYFDGKFAKGDQSTFAEGGGWPVEGIWHLSDGRIFQGDFLNGKPYKGEMQYPDGRRISGQFYPDMNALYGTIEYRDGSEYFGGIEGGTPEGKGSMLFANGDRTIGTFKNGRPHGMALQVKNGEIFYGPFSNGLKDGIGYCSANGASSICSRKGDVDNFPQALRARGAHLAKQEIEAKAKEAQDKVDKEFNDRLSQQKAAVDGLVQRRTLLEGPSCLVSCDHIPRRSWPLFRAKAMLGDLIAGFSSPVNQSHQEQSAA